MKQLTLLALMGAVAMWAAPPDYFPLQAGNRWVLQTASATPQLLSIEVLRSRIWNGSAYFLVSGYTPEPRWVRQTPDGWLVALDEKSGGEQKLTHLAAGGDSYTTPLSGCDQPVLPLSATVAYRGSNFDFDAALAIAYDAAACRDVGIQEETYAPDIGLVRRTVTTIRGPVAFDLVYARVNGAPVLGRSKEIVLIDNFSHGSNGWLPGFTDYGLGNGDLRMLAELRALPDEVDPNRSGYYLQSVNRSDDVFMFLKRHVSSEDGLEPNQWYQIRFEVRLDSNAASGCVGAGGAPGDSVYLKAGGAADEPVAFIAGREIRLSLDKGQQSAGGRDVGVAGTIANGRSCDGPSQYASLVRTYSHPYPVGADSRGSLWTLAGTDSGYEGLTGVYFESIALRIEPAAVANGRPGERGSRP